MDFLIVVGKQAMITVLFLAAWLLVALALAPVVGRRLGGDWPEGWE